MQVALIGGIICLEQNEEKGLILILLTATTLQI